MPCSGLLFFSGPPLGKDFRVHSTLLFRKFLSLSCLLVWCFVRTISWRDFAALAGCVLWGRFPIRSTYGRIYSFLLSLRLGDCSANCPLRLSYPWLLPHPHITLWNVRSSDSRTAWLPKRAASNCDGSVSQDTNPTKQTLGIVL